ncbi:MAG TPA: hypothetical protein VIJ85_02160 [Rhizomicrobium sp.]
MSVRLTSRFAAFAAIAALSGCDTISNLQLSDMTDWLPSISNSQTFEVAQDQPSLEVRFHGATLKKANVDDSGNEIALQLDSTADASEFAAMQRRVPDWILGTHTDANTANIVARQAASFSAEPTPDGFVLKIAPRAVAAETPPITAVSDTVSENPLDGLQREDLGVAFGVAQTPPPEAPPRGSL